MAAHPLAIELIERLRGKRGARVLDFGGGRGRNTRALRVAGLDVTAFSDDEAAGRGALDTLQDAFDAVLATHALLHGTPQSVAERVDAIGRVLGEAGLFYATFASVRDARWGRGERLTEETFAPTEGDERGVPHVYYDEQRLRAVLAPHFAIESLVECNADQIAGTWAHPNTPLRGAVHWFLRALKAT